MVLAEAQFAAAARWRGQVNMERFHTDDTVVLALGNVFEFNERHNSKLPLTRLAAKRRSRESFGVSADLALLWESGSASRIVVTPRKPNGAYLNYLQKHLDIPLTILSPRLRTGWVCRDLLLDGSAMSQLIALIGQRGVRVVAWGATTDYYMLLAALKERGLRIMHHDFPSFENRWVVDYCDSKSGARALLQYIGLASPHVRVAPGIVCHDLTEAGGIAALIHEQRGVPVVVKSDWGAGGKAVRILDADDNAPSFRYIWERFLSEVHSDTLWDNVPVTVEEAVGAGRNLTTPSVDGHIDEDGSIRVLGVQNMLTIQQRCVGFEMGYGVLAAELEARLRRAVEDIGHYLSLIGYRGWFDVDFLLPDDSTELFISEINPRRTGGSSPLEFASKRLGDNWTQAYYLRAFERLELPHAISVQALMHCIVSLNAAYATAPAEILPLHVGGASLRQAYVGYAIWARTKDVALRLEADFSTRLWHIAQKAEAKSTASVRTAIRVKGH